MDFTVKRYTQLLHSLLRQGFSFLSVSDYFRLYEYSPIPNSDFKSQSNNPKSSIPKHPSQIINHKFVILRHDVDAQPLNSLRMARLEHSLGIRGSYYFRMMPQSYNEAVIREIHDLGHEVGYHYETMSFIGDLETKGLRDEETKRPRDHENGREDREDRAYKRFLENLEKFKKIVPVTTICMHGSPLSRFDNREIWKKYDYRELGIMGEASMDIDFTSVAYFTDTGRRWNGEEVSIRDKVESKPRDLETKRQSDLETKRQRDIVTEKRFKTFSPYRSTRDMIRAIEKGTFPEMTILTLHPQRWNDAVGPWLQELIWQNIKNVAKRGLRIWRSHFAS